MSADFNDHYIVRTGPPKKLNGPIKPKRSGRSSSRGKGKKRRRRITFDLDAEGSRTICGSANRMAIIFLGISLPLVGWLAWEMGIITQRDLNSLVNLFNPPVVQEEVVIDESLYPGEAPVTAPSDPDNKTFLAMSFRPKGEPAAVEKLFFAHDLLKSKMHGEAHQKIEEARNADPLVGGVSYTLACTYADETKYDLALEQFQKAAEESPSFALPHIRIALIHFQEKRFDESANAARKAVELAPRQANAYILLSDALRMAGAKKDALVQARIASAIHPDSPSFQAKVRMSRIDLGTFDPLREDLDGHLAVATPSPYWLLTNAGYQISLGDLELGSVYMKKLKKAIDSGLFDAFIQDPLFLRVKHKPIIGRFFNEKDQSKAKSKPQPATKTKAPEPKKEEPSLMLTEPEKKSSGFLDLPTMKAPKPMPSILNNNSPKKQSEQKPSSDSSGKSDSLVPEGGLDLETKDGVSPILGPKSSQ